MSRCVSGSWMWSADPALAIDRVRDLRVSMAAEEARIREADRRRMAARLRKLNRAAAAAEKSKGAVHGR